MIKRYFPISVWVLTLVFLAACADGPSLNAVSSTDVTGSIIRNQDGEALGTVEDVVMDLESGRIRYLIMEFFPNSFSFTKAAFAPSSNDRTAVPPEIVQRDSETVSLILTIEESILNDAPRLSADLDTLNEDWDATVRAYWQEKLN
jgi:sporulation protein YlmC with PRC-barrel domain